MKVIQQAAAQAVRNRTKANKDFQTKQKQLKEK